MKSTCENLSSFLVMLLLHWFKSSSNFSQESCKGSLPPSYSSLFLQSYLSAHNLSFLNYGYIKPLSYRGSLLLVCKLAYADLHPINEFNKSSMFIPIHTLRCVDLRSNCQFANTYNIVAFQFNKIVCTLRKCKIKINEYYPCCKALFICFSLKIILNSASSLFLTLLFLASSQRFLFIFGISPYLTIVCVFSFQSHNPVNCNLLKIRIYT